jgi:hypothetical protein
MSDKLKAVKNLTAAGIEHDQAIDIVFESIEENEYLQFMQEVFKVAFMYAQLHEQNKKLADYQKSDKSALMECIQECTKLIKH